MRHIWVSNLTIIGSDNGLLPGRRQTIIWANAGILLIQTVVKNFSNSNSYIFIQENAFENVVWKMSAILSQPQCVYLNMHRWLTHWGRVMQMCVTKLAIIGSVNGLLPGRRQAIIWTNAGILLIGPLGTNFSEILIEIHTFSFKKIYPKMSSGNGSHFVSASMC